MKIEQFLSEKVEGYIFGDLTSILQIELAPDRQYGRALYPAAMLELAAIELFGTLASTRPFPLEPGAQASAGADRFKEFWEHMYPGSTLATPIRKLLRHGVSHLTLAKPFVHVTASRAQHLAVGPPPDHEIIFDVSTMRDDLWTAYERHVRSLLATEHTRLQERLDEIERATVADAQERLRALVPTQGFVAPTHSSTGFGGTTSIYVRVNPQP